METLIGKLGKGLTKIFGSANDRQVKDLRHRVEVWINPLEEEIAKLSDEQLRAKTDDFRKRLADGETMDDILNEAFAVVREVGKRVLDMRHYDVQLIGGMVLHGGNIAEMVTGEGKTLVSTLSAYINALEGKGVHVITVNDYLARRDAQWMGPLHHALGLTVGVIQGDMYSEAYMYHPEANDEPEHKLRHLALITRQEAYNCDITYGTNNEFGFDYLRDNMKTRKEDQVQRGHNYAIVDEVDSILIDEARTPLIISGPTDESTEKYYTANRVAKQLRKDEHFEVKEKEHAVILNEEGILKAQELVGVEDFYTGANMEWPHHIEQALRAHNIYQLDRDYVVNEGEIVIVDEFTGRMMAGRRWSDGLHQAVEAKENLKIRSESQTYATITLQNYFKMYEKLSGMTGTAATEAQEFEKIYGCGVVVIPTNRPLQRDNMPDMVFGTEPEKYDAVIDEVVRQHEAGRPVLVGTTSIERSEMLSKMLRQRGVDHEVLNAKHHEREATIVSKAGQPGSVVIATNMAGRGTDIVLGEGVKDNGGLAIVGTERHESRRIDNQLRGRSGRQGDPGSSQFFLSMEDDIMRKFAPPWAKDLLVKMGLKDGQAIESPMVTKSIQKAQKNVENRNFEIRKNLLEYDEVMNEQRKVIYSLRQQVLQGADMKDVFEGMIADTAIGAIDLYLPREARSDDWDYEGLADWIKRKCNTRPDPAGWNKKSDKEIEEEVRDLLIQKYRERREEMGIEAMNAIEKYVLLNELDDKWKDHLYNMDQLKSGVGLRGYGQKDPKLEYKIEGREMFGEMMGSIRETVSELIFRVRLASEEEKQQRNRWAQAQETKNEASAAPEGEVEKPKPIISGPKVGRNDPCPCGSGRKYKKCCG